MPKLVKTPRVKLITMHVTGREATVFEGYLALDREAQRAVEDLIDMLNRLPSPTRPQPTTEQGTT